MSTFILEGIQLPKALLFMEVVYHSIADADPKSLELRATFSLSQCLILNAGIIFKAVCENIFSLSCNDHAIYLHLFN